MTKQTLDNLDRIRAITIDPSSYRDADNSVEIVFSTGALAVKYDKRTDLPYIENLPLEGMDLSELNAGAHVLRSHNYTDVANVIGSVVPGSAQIINGEARARIALSREASDAELVNKIRTGIVRKWSYGYHKVGRYTVTTDEETGMEVRTWARHVPYELSAVAVPADLGTNTRDQDMQSQASDGANTGGQETMKAVDNGTRAAVSDVVITGTFSGTVEDEPTPEETPAAEEAARAEDGKDEDDDEVRGRKMEAARQDGIRALAQKARLEEKDIRAMLKDLNCSVEAAGVRMLDIMASRDGQRAEVRSQVEITRDQQDTRMHGMSDALAYRARPNGKPSDAAREYVGFRMVDFARECLENGGVRTRGMAPSALLDAALFGTRGYHSTGDFPLLLANATNKNFMGGYSQESRNFEGIATRRVVPNFKAVSELNLSGASSLDVTPEGAEIKYGTLTEGGETWNLVSLTKGLKVTRQALINDDLNAFGEVPARMGASVVRAELDRFWAMLTANATMSDGYALFHAANHKNYTASSGGAPSTEQIAKGRLLLRKMTDLGGQVLNLIPTHIVIPPDLETTLDQLLAQIMANQTSNVVPQIIRSLQPIVEPRLTAAKPWYLVAASWPSLVYGYLEGNEGPRISSRESWEIQGVEMKVEHDFGCGVSDYRGLYLNAGQ